MLKYSQRNADNANVAAKPAKEHMDRQKGRQTIKLIQMHLTGQIDILKYQIQTYQITK